MYNFTKCSIFLVDLKLLHLCRIILEIMLSQLSHKCTKLGILKVQSIVIKKLMWNMIYFFQPAISNTWFEPLNRELASSFLVEHALIFSTSDRLFPHLPFTTKKSKRKKKKPKNPPNMKYMNESIRELVQNPVSYPL